MSKRRKRIQFIGQNQNLPLPELAAKTGLSQQEISEILLKLKLQPKDLKSNHEDVKNYSWVYPFISTMASVLVYLPTLKNGFVNWDDPQTIINNLYIRSLNLQTIHWMLTTFLGGNWMPCTWFSFAMDFQTGGLNPWIFHLTNILLHAVNTLLVFSLCIRILRIVPVGLESASGVEKNEKVVWAAFLTSVLFGLHPLHVESVAWVTERKDVLYAFFYLLALLLYLNYASALQQKNLKFFACLGLFVLSLMSKPMAVTLPLVLLIFDVWILRRLQTNPVKVLAEKVPFFVIALSAGLIAIKAQGQTAFSLLGNLSIYFRLMNASRSLIFYLWKMILPFNLVPLYPFPQLKSNFYNFESFICVFLVLGISFVCFQFCKKAPYLMPGWLYYLVTLAPVLGILQVGFQAAADRYTYLPCVGIFLLFSTGVSFFILKKQSSFVLLCVLLTSFMGMRTFSQIGVWHDSLALWETVLKNYPDDTPQFAHKNLATAYQIAGRPNDALQEYDKAIALPPPEPSIHSDKATVLFDMGQKEEAIQELKYAISLDPNYIPAHKNLVIIYKRMGLDDASAIEMKEVLKIQQRNFEP